MNLPITYDDLKLIKKAVRVKIESYTKASREAEASGYREKMVDYCELAEAYSDVLDKLNEVDDD